MDPARLIPTDLLTRARALRRGQSTPEVVLWFLLRDRGLLGLKFRRQHPLGPFIADFYCDELKWVIEVDGGQHNTVEARDYDQRRSDYLATRNVTVTRFWSNEVMDEIEGVVARLLDAASGLAAQASPGTLTPALSQREREAEALAHSPSEKE